MAAGSVQPTMTIRRTGLSLLVVLALAGCANGTSGDSAGAPAAPPSSAPAATAEAPTESAPSPGVPTAGGIETISGTISPGVEPDCLLLDGRLLIVGDSKLKAAVKPGATVTVTGRAAEGMMTTCQQGTPFVVTAVRAN